MGTTLATIEKIGFDWKVNIIFYKDNLVPFRIRSISITSNMG